MAKIIASSGTIAYWTEEDGWKEVGNLAHAELEIADDKPQEKIGRPSDIVGKVYHLEFTLDSSSALYGIVVGMQLQYNLRELHRNMGRLVRWPNTN